MEGRGAQKVVLEWGHEREVDSISRPGERIKREWEKEYMGGLIVFNKNPEADK